MQRVAPAGENPQNWPLEYRPNCNTGVPVGNVVVVVIIIIIIKGINKAQDRLRGHKCANKDSCVNTG